MRNATWMGTALSDFLAFAGWFGKEVPTGTGEGGTPSTSTDFDLDEYNGTPTGIAYANNRFYVADLWTKKVYAYTGAGQRVSSADFDLDGDNTYPTGITYADNRFYVADIGDEKVYAYTGAGQRVAGADFDLDRYNTAPSGIAYADNRFYVVDGTDRKVHVYTVSGQIDDGVGDTGQGYTDDRAVLEALYNATDGRKRVHSEN